jgi:hypothetical protein
VVLENISKIVSLYKQLNICKMVFPIVAHMTHGDYDLNKLESSLYKEDVVEI